VKDPATDLEPVEVDPSAVPAVFARVMGAGEVDMGTVGMTFAANPVDISRSRAPTST
jgi:hypothetical protein